MTPDIAAVYIFSLDFEVIPKGRPRVGRGRVFTPKRTVDFEKRVKEELKKQFKEYPITAPVHINARFYFKKAKSCKAMYMTKRPDTDNCLKSVFDAMNGIVFNDDSQIVSIDAMKAYDERPRIELSVYEFEE